MKRIISILAALALTLGLAVFVVPAASAAGTSSLCQKVRTWSGAGCTSANTRAFWKDQEERRRAANRADRDRGHAVGYGVWDRLAKCEAGGNWSINTGNGYYGGLQFSLSSWRAAGGSGRPDLASRVEQIRRGERLKAMQGWGAWPSCSRKLGLR